MIPTHSPTFTGSLPGSPAWLILPNQGSDKPKVPPFPATAKVRRPEYLAQGRALLALARDALGRSGRPALRRIVDGSTGWMRSVASRLVNGAETLASWFTRSVRGLVYRHYAGALALTNGETPPADVLDQVDDDTDDQAGLLVRFRDAIVEGVATSVATAKGIVARAGSYGSAVWATGVNAFRKLMSRTKTLERRVLGLVEAHCHQCPYLARLGWKPIGTLPRLGDTICQEGCRCHFEYK